MFKDIDRSEKINLALGFVLVLALLCLSGSVNAIHTIDCAEESSTEELFFSTYYTFNCSTGENASSVTFGGALMTNHSVGNMSRWAVNISAGGLTGLSAECNLSNISFVYVNEDNTSITNTTYIANLTIYPCWYGNQTPLTMTITDDDTWKLVYDERIDKISYYIIDALQTNLSATTANKTGTMVVITNEGNVTIEAKTGGLNTTHKYLDVGCYRDGDGDALCDRTYTVRQDSPYSLGTGGVLAILVVGLGVGYGAARAKQ